uniref:Ubiquitin carboxyl-terminal hydrolase n=1 Tax=Hanusia phi TaxID=3032 RepID=A0A7S0F546_9CRYP
MEEKIKQFHETCGGDVADVAALFHALFPHKRFNPQTLGKALGIAEEKMLEGPQVKVTLDQLQHGVQTVSSEESMEVKVEVIDSFISFVREEKEIEAKQQGLELDEAWASELEQRLLTNVKTDKDLMGHLEGVRSLHESWRQNCDDSDESRYPSVVAGPQVLSMDDVFRMFYSRLLTEDERSRLFLRPNESPSDLLRSKLEKFRNKADSSIAKLQRERIVWLMQQATGVEINESCLCDLEKIRELDERICKRMDENFSNKIDKILKDVSLGPSPVRIQLVETEIVKSITGSADEMSWNDFRGYQAVALYACLRALAEENGEQGTVGGLIGSSLKLIKATRRKIGDRFFRKKWLPLESNPDIFNELGYQIGLPMSVSFFEVFGFDPELLALVPSPTYAVLVCFPITPSYKESVDNEASGGEVGAGAAPFFVHQTVGNACGTVAMIHAFASIPAELREEGKGGWLYKFVSSHLSKSPLECAAALEEDEDIAMRHNELARKGDTNVEKFRSGAEESSFQSVLHFICYVEKDGTLYELDGMRKAPVARGSSSQQTLLQDSIAVVQEMMAKSDNELMLNVIALAKQP